MNEVWKDIECYEKIYQISNFGRIRRIIFVNNVVSKPKISYNKIQDNGKGYKVICLYKNNEKKQLLVHRLVANAFIPKIKGKGFVNHKNGNKNDNRVENLEWCNQFENMQHAYKTGLATAHTTGKFGANSKKAIKVNMIDKNTNNILNTFNAIVDAARFIGIKQSGHIVSCCKGKLKSAYGYRWEYV